MIGHRFKANYQKEPFHLISNNEQMGVTEQERPSN